MTLKNLAADFAELSRQAEKQLQAQAINPMALSPEECSRVFNELQVHQIELEMQNEELRRAQDQLAESRNKYADLYDFTPVGYLSLDARGKIVEANLTAASLLKVERGRLVGSFFPHYLGASDRRHLHRLLKGRPDQPEQRLEVQIATGGVDRTMLLNILFSEDTQERQQCRVSLTDVTELKRAQEELRLHKVELEEKVTALQGEIVDREQAEARLKESDARFTAFMRHLPGSAIMRDREGRFLFVNESWDKTLGRQPGETLGRTVDDFWPPQIADRLKEIDQEVFAQNRPLESMVELPVGGIKRTFLTYRFPIRNETGQVEMVGAIGIDITERLQAEEARDRLIEDLRKSEENLRLLATQLLTAQEDERKRLAAELHDELGHALLTLKLHLSAVERHLLPTQVDLKEKMRDMVAYLTDTVEEVRRLYHDLSPGDLEDLGLTSALRTMVADFQELYENIDGKVELTDIDDLFPRHTQIMIYRVVQEALTNIGKHAYPEHVKVKVTKEDQQVVFSIEDDGRGFSTEELLGGNTGQKGMGLAAMAQRVSLVGGIFDLWSQENQGSRIIFSIPFALAGESV